MYAKENGKGHAKVISEKLIIADILEFKYFFSKLGICGGGRRAEGAERQLLPLQQKLRQPEGGEGMGAGVTGEACLGEICDFTINYSTWF